MIKIYKTDKQITSKDLEKYSEENKAKVLNCSRCGYPYRTEDLIAAVDVRNHLGYLYCPECYKNGLLDKQVGIAVDNRKVNHFISEITKAGFKNVETKKFTETVQLITIIFAPGDKQKLVNTIQLCEYHFTNGN